MKFRWIIALLILGLLVTVIFPGPFGRVKGVAWGLLDGPTKTTTTAAHSSRSFADVIRSIRHLADETKDLKAENLRLQAEVGRLANIEHENEVLRKEFGFVHDNRTDFDLIPTLIIGRSPSSFLQTIMIGSGTKNGVSSGQAVVSQGFFVGRVVETTDTTATVELITASRSLIPITLTDSRDTGLLKGGLAGLTGEEFQTSTVINLGDQLVTSGLGTIVPAGLPVGTIDHKLTASADFVQRFAVHSPIEFSKLEAVVIVKPKG